MQDAAITSSEQVFLIDKPRLESLNSQLELMKLDPRNIPEDELEELFENLRLDFPTVQ